jgi:hypothetical protein
VHSFLGLTTFKPFLTLHEAEALDASTAENEVEVEIDVVSKPLLWRTLLMSSISVVETLAWLTLGSYRFITNPFHPSSLLPFILALTWIYVSVRPILRPSSTPPYDLFALFVIHLVMGVLMLGGVLYAHHVLAAPQPGRLSMLGLVGNLVGVIVGLVVVINIPMAVPSSRVKKEDIVCSSLDNVCLCVVYVSNSLCVYVGSRRIARGLFYHLAMDNIRLGVSAHQTGTAPPSTGRHDTAYLHARLYFYRERTQL